MHFLELFLFIILSSFVVGCQLATNDVEGCYWRDYRGTIPNDAVQVGINDYGKRIYIGQAVHYQKLMPGRIFEGHNSMSYVWGDNKNEYVVTEAIKILCTHHPENIKWTEVDSSKLQALSPVDFIMGGYDNGIDLYIGRTSSEGHTGVGKITIRGQDTFGYSEENGTVVWTDSGYEVLSYTGGNENKPSSAKHTIQSNGKVINIYIN